MVYSLSLSLSLSLGVPVSEAAVIDLNQVSGNEIVLTEDSSLLQSYLPTISKGETFAIKGKHTGVSGFLCLGRLFQGQPNEAALCI